MEKYYTPTIDEFHVGFEYEILGPKDWIKEVWKIHNFSEGRFKANLTYAESIRVKCLDREDIESFNFVRSEKNMWIGWHDYTLDTITGQYGYYLKATLHYPIMDDFYRIIVHRYLDNTRDIENKIEEGESKLVYEGTIKNKSELKKLLVQLKII